MAIVASLLNDGYQLTIPQTAVTDCNPHMLEVTVQGQTQSAAFNRCDTTPEPFEFEAADNVPGGSVVVSNAAVITGIEGPVDVTVTGGEYSIGCNGTFISTPGIAQPDDEVCVRHTATGGAGAINETLLIAGGVGAFFISTVANSPPPPPPPPDNDGGGGLTRVAEVLMLLGLLFATRRRLAL